MRRRRRLTRRTARPSLVLGGLIVGCLLAVALAAPALAPTPEGGEPGVIPRYGTGPEPEPPSREHPLGLMQDKYDLLYGLVWGTRAVFRLGLLVVLGRAVTGGLVGLVAGYAGGWLDGLLMRITDAFLAFPVVAAAMVMLSLFGFAPDPAWGSRPWFVPNRTEQVIAATLVLFGWMAYARLVRGNVLAEREKEYVVAARAGGARRDRILLRHLLPNSSQGLLVMMASDVGAVVVTLLAFTFIGLIGATSGTLLRPDWGQMLAMSRNWVIGTGSDPFAYWYTYLPVSLAVVLFSMGWNLIGDGLRDALDPRLR